MFWVDTKRIIRAGWLGFNRNPLVSAASVLVLTVTLSIIAGLLLLSAILNFSLAEIKDKVDITVYFNIGAPSDKILNLKSSLEKLPEVAQVSYVSDKQALQNFRAKHADDYLTIQALDELSDNPLGAYLTIKAKDPSQYESISGMLSGGSVVSKDANTFIDKINYHQNKVVIDRLNTIIKGAKTLGFAITLVFALISIAITLNTIRLAIFISREEIGVMKLVGAGNKYVRGPFTVQGAIYGGFATLITLIIFFPITIWLGRHMTDFFSIDLFNYYLANFFQFFLIIAGSGIALGVISSFIAIRRYLNK